MGKNRSIRWKLSVLASLSLVAVAGITLLAVRLAAARHGPRLSDQHGGAERGAD